MPKKTRVRGPTAGTRSVLSPDQIDEALKHLLMGTLALYVLNHSSRPISNVMEDLMQIEMRSAVTAA